MRVPFVVLDAPLVDVGAGALLPVDAETRHHLVRVLRRGDGDEVEVTDGRGRRAPAELAGDAVRLRGTPTSDPAPVPSVRVVHALAKGRVLDEVVRVLAELGVARFSPVVTARTVSRPEGRRADAAVERWRAVARAAAAQARSARVLHVDAIRPLDWGSDDPARSDVRRLVAHPGAPRGVGDVLGPPVRRGDVGAIDVAVGPEGGFGDDELAAAREQGWSVVRLGTTVLRTAHAAPIVVASAVALSGGFDTE